MKFINRLERKFGKFGIENLIRYVVFGKAIVYILSLVNASIIGLLELNRGAIFSGQIWRIVTFVFVPPTGLNVLWVLISLYFYYFIGTYLEREWGSFKFTLYYLIGSLSAVGVCLATGAYVDNYYLNMTMFLALAMVYPDMQVRLFFILPVKMKYLAMLDGAFILFQFFVASLQGKVLILVLLANFFLFFGGQMIKSIKNLFNRKRHSNNFKTKSANTKNYYHKCHVCGRTELDDPDLEFRYCSKCDGSYEYCMDHLLDHEHIKKTD